MTLSLTFGALSLTLGNRILTPFTDTNYPRQRIDTPTFSRSFAGSVIGAAPPYEPPHTWSVGALLREADAAKLQRMYSLWLLTRPFAYVALEDRVQRIYEPGVVSGDRTRGLVTGTTAVLDASGLSYLAKFNVLFVDTPEFSENGAWVRCQFQLIEGVKTTP